MVYLSITVATLILAISFLGEYKRKSPVFSFYASLLLVFYIPFTLSYALEPEYPDYVYLVGSAFSAVYIAVFSLSLWIIRKATGTDGVWLKAFDIQNLQMEISSRSRMVPVILACLSILGFIVSLKLYSFSALATLNWWDLVNSDSPLTLFSTYLAYSSAGIIPLAIARYRTGKFDSLSFIIAIIWMGFATLILQTRSFLLIFMFPGVAYLFLNSSKKTKAIASIMIPVAAILYVGARAVRHAGGLEAFLTGDMSSLFSGASEGSEQSLFDAFLHFILIDNHFPGFGENITLRRIIFFGVPPLKPPEFSYIMHTAYFGYGPKEGLSMHPTVFGDAWGNAGYWGAVIYSVMLAIIVHLIERLIKSTNNQVIVLSCFGVISVTLMIFARGAVYNGFMFTALPLVIVWILVSVSQAMELDGVPQVTRSFANKR